MMPGFVPTDPRIMKRSDVGKYRITFMQEIAHRANVYAQLEGQWDGETIHSEGSEWQAVAANGALSGSAPNGNERIHFSLTPVKRTPPTLVMKPPPGAIVRLLSWAGGGSLASHRPATAGWIVHGSAGECTENPAKVVPILSHNSQWEEQGKLKQLSGFPSV